MKRYHYKLKELDIIEVSLLFAQDCPVEGRQAETGSSGEPHGVGPLRPGHLW